MNVRETRTREWVLVADEGSAALFAPRTDGADLAEVGRISDVAVAVIPAQADATGRIGTAQALGAEADKVLADRFARRVIRWVAGARESGRFSRLRVVAAPRFLGLLRSHIGRDLRPLIRDEAARNLVHLDGPELSNRLYSNATQTAS